MGFTKEKNVIMEQTKDWATCRNAPQGGGQYNEFDSNGLSVNFAGVLSVESGGAAPRTHSPTDDQLCVFLTQDVPSRKSFPVYAFDGYTCKESPSLEINRYLTCGTSHNDEILV